MRKTQLPSLILVFVLALLPLSEKGYLTSIDHALTSVFDRALGGSPEVLGPSPRDLALRRLVDRTGDLLLSEGAFVSRRRLNEIARIADRAGLQYQLPPSLILSVIHSESHFRSDAVSPVGAVGLMQIQLATARHIAQTEGFSEPTMNALFDPELNIRLGTGYLRQLIDRFGNVRTALAAYNVGPSEIGRRIVDNEPFSDRYGKEIRQRETFFAVSPASPQPAAAAPVTVPAADPAAPAVVPTAATAPPQPIVVTASARNN